MKLGFVSAILDGWTFEEMIDTASELGFSSAWKSPAGRRAKRSAAMRASSHIDTDRTLEDRRKGRLHPQLLRRRARV